MRNTLFMMIGLPCSGKTTIAKSVAKIENATIISYSKIRNEIFKNENYRDNYIRVYDVIEKRIKDALKRGNVIYDDTNIDYKRRKSFIARFDKVKKIAILVATPYDICLERNEENNRKNSSDRIKEMYYNFYIPQKYEGFDDIRILYNYDPEESEYKIQYLLEEIDIPQDNPHHTLSIEKHCLKAYAYILQNDPKNEVLCYAALLHDIGKKDTKTFINKKGEETSIAHYYSHQYVGAYMALFYLSNLEEKIILEICNLIQWHMLVDDSLAENTKERYKNMLGEKEWNNLQMIHKADMFAK